MHLHIRERVGQSVRAQQQPRAQRKRHTAAVRLDLGPDADSARDHIAARVAMCLLRQHLPARDQLLHERVIRRDLLHTAQADQIRAAVTDVQHREPSVPHAGGDDRRTHAAQLGIGTGAAVDRLIGRVAGCAHRRLDRAARHHLPAKLRQKGRRGKLARKLPAGSAAHTVADDADNAALAPDARTGGTVLILLADSTPVRLCKALHGLSPFRRGDPRPSCAAGRRTRPHHCRACGARSRSRRPAPKCV